MKEESTGYTIDSNESVPGTIRECGITYVVTNGSTIFSDGKVGFIKYLPDGKFVVPIIGDKEFDDIYYAAEALYEELKHNARNY